MSVCIISRLCGFAFAGCLASHRAGVFRVIAVTPDSPADLRACVVGKCCLPNALPNAVTSKNTHAHGLKEFT